MRFLLTTGQDELSKASERRSLFHQGISSMLLLLMHHGGVILTSEPWTLGQDYSTLNRSTIAQTLEFVLADIAIGY